MPLARKKIKAEEPDVSDASETDGHYWRRNEEAAHDHLNLFINLPSAILLAIIVGVAHRLQNAVAPLQSPSNTDDRDSRFILRDHGRVVASARMQVSQALNDLLAAEAALLLRTGELHVAESR
jgi:hypothetical protein